MAAKSNTSKKLRITEHDYEWHPRFLAPIMGLFCAMYMITIALNAKFIDIYGFIFPVGIITFPVCCVLTDLLTEVYGFNRTRQAIWTALLCTGLFALFMQIAVWLKPAGFWTYQEPFAAMFGQTPRIALAGAMAWVVGEFLNTYVMSKMKILQAARFMPVRFIASTVVGQFFDTLVFATVAFYGVLSDHNLVVLIFSGWAFKVLYEIIALPLSVPAARFMKRIEGVEHYDRQKLRLV